jgi:hypothetical protein
LLQAAACERCTTSFSGGMPVRRRAPRAHLNQLRRLLPHQRLLLYLHDSSFPLPEQR